MAVLGSHQRLSRVTSVFGDGSDGDFSSATIPSTNHAGCSGSSGGTAVTTDVANIQNGDIVLLHQSRGTGVGQWEINKVASGGGTTSLTMQKNLQYTYTDSGDDQAQITNIPQYNNVTVQSGTWSVPVWNNSRFGILALACKDTFTITGTIDGGGDPASGQTAGAGVGFDGGSVPPSGPGNTGEGNIGALVANQGTRNGTGGGGATGGAATGGGGGGHGTAGSDGTGTDGQGGTTSGSADLTNMTFGGGGGGNAGGGTPGGGGGGGGIVLLFGKTFTITGAIDVNGGTGGTGGNDNDGGGGAGGSVLIACIDATLGTNKITSTGGAGGTNRGGAGGVGRIAVHHSGTLSGSTNPSLTDVTDPLWALPGGGNPIFFDSGSIA